MNDMNPTPPPQLPPHMQFTPPAEDPTEQMPIKGFAGVIEAILRQPRRVHNALRQPGIAGVIGSMVFGALVFALIYGVVVGTFSRGPQFWTASRTGNTSTRRMR